MGAAALLEVLRAWPEGPRGLRVRDEAALVQAAARHGLAGFLQYVALQGGVELGPEQRLRLRREAMAQAAVGLRVKGLLLRAVEALAAEGTVPVLLKGYGLALRYYPEPLLRATSDVDVLVGREQVARARGALERLGLRARGEGHEHHLELAGPAGLVELHHRALSGWGLVLEAEGLLARAEPGEVEGRAVRYLRAEDELPYLALHASNHLLQRLAWLFDLKLLVRARPGLDWAEVVAQAQGAGWGPAVWYALEAARRLVGAAVPEQVLQALAPPLWQRRLAVQLFTAEHLLDTQLAEHKAAWWVYKALLAPRLVPVVRYAARRLLGASR